MFVLSFSVLCLEGPKYVKVFSLSSILVCQGFNLQYTDYFILQNLPSVFPTPDTTQMLLSHQSLLQHKSIPLASAFQSKFAVDSSMKMSWAPETQYVL